MNEPDFVFRCVMELVTAGNLDNDNNNENDNSDEEGSRKRKRELQNNDDEEFDSDSDSESDIDNSATTSGLEQQRAWRHAKNVARFLGEMIARNQTRKRIMVWHPHFFYSFASPQVEILTTVLRDRFT